MTEFVGFAGMSEAQLRQFVAQLFYMGGGFQVAKSGVLGATGLKVVQTSTASASVVVGRGMAVQQSSALAGALPLLCDSDKTLDILTANPMGGVPRNDIVVFDSATETIRNIVGTPNAVPTDPTIPSTAVALGRLRHAAGATTVPTDKIDDLRTFTTMRGGILTTFTQADRDSAFPVEGNAVYRGDLDTMQLQAGSGWVTVGLVSDPVAGKRTHWGTATVDIGADGFVVADGNAIVHGAGFTPRIVDVIYKGTTGSLFNDIVTDTYTSTTFRCRMFGLNGAAVAATGLPIGFICYE